MIRYTHPEAARKIVARRRLLLFQLGLGLGYSLVAARALFLMLQDNQKLETIAAQQYRAVIQETAGRGRILDRRGNELAMDIPSWSLFADPKEVTDPYTSAQRLAPVLGASSKTILNKLKTQSRFVWIQRRVSPKIMDKIRALQLKGIHGIKENKRYYPHGVLAGHVLGAVGLDAKALGGIELAYDTYLMRRPPAGLYLRDAKGRLYLAPTTSAGSPDKGDVYLTLDRGLQFLAEDVLKKAVQKYSAQGGAILLMDPASGDILALANYPFFDPNQFEKVPMARWRNRALTDVFEPGSTFKLVFLAAALESKLLSLNERIDCENGHFLLAGGHVIHDTKPHGLLTPREIVKVSSNIGAAKIARRLGRRGMYEWIKALGFGQKTGIDFPSEAEGILRHYKAWSSVEEATIAFGQGVGTTPLQMVRFYAAVANGGSLVRPHFVEKVVSEEGAILYQAAHEYLPTPLKISTTLQLKQMLKEVVLEGGTAQAAFIEEYPVGGKTGTSQKSLPRQGYVAGKYIASFVGFAPLDQPRLVLLVLIDEPAGTPYTGGQVAAPFFKEMMLRSLQYLGIPPHGEGPMPPVWEAYREEGDPWSSDRRLNPSGDRFEVPDFSGATLRDVLKAVTPHPVRVEFKGRGVARHQRPAAGTLVSAGSRIYVEFAPLY